jgi:hypothetical protein
MWMEEGKGEPPSIPTTEVLNELMKSSNSPIVLYLPRVSFFPSTK